MKLELSADLMTGRRVVRFEGMEKWWVMPSIATTDAAALHYVADMLDNYADGNLEEFKDTLNVLLREGRKRDE